MHIIKVVAVALAAAISCSQAFGQSNEPDWRVAGYDGKDMILYSVPDMVREPDGLVRVWSEELNFKVSQQAVTRAVDKHNKQFIDAVAGRVARYYVPPFMLSGIDNRCKSSEDKNCVANEATDIAMTEEVANEHLVRADGQILNELDCKNRRGRALQIVTYNSQGSPHFMSGSTNWIYAPPQSTLDWLLTIVCNPKLAAVDNTPLKRRMRADASKAGRSH